MGATVEGETPPIRIAGGGLRGISYTTPVPSAQIKSCVLLAGLRAEGVTVVTETVPSRDHTERMLAALGAPITLSGNGPFTASVIGGYSLRGFDFTAPADISSAAFFMVAAALLPGSELVIEDLSVNPSRTGILDVFRQAGAPCAVENERSELGEPVGDVAVRFSPSLRPFTIEGSLVPRLIDEIPVLAVMATQCQGMSVIRDAKELRVKESDRIEMVAAGLRAMGARVETFEDGMAIHGPCRLRGARIETAHDHRIAMAFAIAGLIAQGQTTIEGAEAISTSYPRFEQDLMGLCIV
jgi:3-phosphoshikimate 1-carboxyvinyltransferase